MNDKSCGGFSLLKGLIISLMGSWSSERAERSTGLSLRASALIDSVGIQQRIQCIREKSKNWRDGESKEKYGKEEGMRRGGKLIKMMKRKRGNNNNYLTVKHWLQAAVSLLLSLSLTRSLHHQNTANQSPSCLIPICRYLLINRRLINTTRCRLWVQFRLTQLHGCCAG